MRRSSVRLALLATLIAIVSPLPVSAQTTGRILGRVTDAQTGEPLATVELRVEGLEVSVLTSERGDFILTGIPAGERRLVVHVLGFQPATLTVLVRPSRTVQLMIKLTPAPVEIEGVAAEVERARLIEPEVVVTHQIVLGRELRELPVDDVEEAVELTPGVTGGHFRGGRIGQETYLIDGLEVKNQFEASSRGSGLELSPNALEEIEVVTGGTRPEYGSALAGAVSYVTRRGNPERWEGKASISSDNWLPDDIYQGFSALALTVGGPLRPLGDGVTVFADLLAQGMIDGDPRARGLTCLRPEDGDEDLAVAINALATDPLARHLYCPYARSRIPYQRGDRLIGFLRFDAPVAASTNISLSILHNRRQQELYTREFKYNSQYQLGQRTKGYLATLTLDWSRHDEGRAYYVTARAAAMRIDRHLGALDPWTFSDRGRIAGFGLRDFRFLGEQFVHQPLEQQLTAGSAVPGYLRPGGSGASPFGPAADGIFFTDGTPDIASWNRTDFIGGDLVGEMLSARGHALRAGASARFYRVENYERVLAYLPGSSPSFARFYPVTANAWTEVSILAADNITAQLGIRLEGFRSGLSFPTTRADFLSPVIDTEFKTFMMPRVGVAIPVPFTDDRTVVFFNYGRVAQPPDFRFFLDSSIGDSLRVDIKRQGNPDLAYESGSAYEFGLRHLLRIPVAFNATVYIKELNNLVTSGLTFPDIPGSQFTTGDFGSVRGLELSVRARWPTLRAHFGYALQEATGVTSGAFEAIDSAVAEQRIEFPLAFDRRHSIDFGILVGRAAGATDWRLGGALTGSVQSGFPIDRLAAAGEPTDEQIVRARLPWTGSADLRLSYELGGLGICGGCRWRLLFDARNITNRENVIALRRDTGSVAPEVSDLVARVGEIPTDFEPIPIESSRYSPSTDLNRDGLITAAEYETARFAAALDYSDPSLYFGEPLQVRLGMEILF